MKWQGNKIGYVIYGESHSPAIGIRMENLPEFKLDTEELDGFLARRKAVRAAYSTSRTEEDKIIWKSGFNNSVISGTVTAEIENKNVKKGDYDELKGKPRPSHADYASFAKFGRVDFGGGREFSGRMTAPYCILGGIAKQILRSKGVEVLAYISQIGKAKGKSYLDSVVTAEEIKNSPNGILSGGEEMQKEIELAKNNLDSVGGIIECIVFGLPAGVGYTMAEGLESEISRQVFSVPAVKGIEFGSGFNLAAMNGSFSNDEFFYDGDKVKTYTNNSGGINGGISNGMPVTLRVAVRPTPSIARQQRTVDLIEKKDTVIAIKGRHDVCIVPRAVPVIESAVAIALLDNLL